MMARLADVILAAGASRRFGARKLLARCGGPTLLERAAAAGRDAGLTGTIAVFGALDGPLMDAATDAALAFTINADWRGGQGTSVATAISSLPEDCAGVLIRTADQVLVDGVALRGLAEAWHASPDHIVAAHYAGTLGVPAILPRRCFGALRSLQGEHGARRIIATDARVVAVALDDAAVDVDTRDDLARAELLIVSRARGARNARS